MIKIFYGTEGAAIADGLVIIIDVFRAATLDAYILAQGATYIIPVRTAKKAFSLKKSNSKIILVGENEGHIIEGFNYGNSPQEIRDVNFSNKIIVHRSSQGTQGIRLAKHAHEIILGSFVTFSAIRNYSLRSKFNNISLVAMAGKNSDDEEFVKAFLDSLKGKSPNMDYIKEKLRKHPHMQLFLNPKNLEFPREDFELCLTLDKFSFICRAEKINNNTIIKKLNIQ